MDDFRRELRDMLVRRSVKVGGPFTLTSGRTSDFYIDTKLTTTSARGMVAVGNVLCDLLAAQGVAPDAVCGLTLGADPILGAISYASVLRGRPIDHLIIRKEPKGHGTKRWIEGSLDGIVSVVVVDDVWTTGGSTLKAVTAAREAGLKILAAMALVDREEGAQEALAEFATFAAYTKTELLAAHRVLHSQG